MAFEERPARLNSRLIGMLKARLPELGLDRVEDRRRRAGQRWSLSSVLRAVVVAMVAGRQSLAEMEALTFEMSPAVGRVLGFARRLSDTTARNVLVRVLPFALRQVLYRLVKVALRRKALPLSGLPFHAVALDGKVTSLSVWDNHYAQQQHYDEGRQARGLVRVVNSVLLSTPAKPVLDCLPIPAETNEMGIFPTAFAALVQAYGDLFRLVTYDAGVTSEDNCRLVVEAGKDFCFRIKNECGWVMREAQNLLDFFPKEKAKAHTEQVLSNGESVHRYVFLCAVVGECFWGFPQVKTIVRVLSERVRDGRAVAQENRYFISSLKVAALSAPQWLFLIRNHWSVENQCHWTADAIFQEDEKPWIETHPRGTVVLMLLRRIAYNLLALFRGVTQHSEEKRQTPWKDVLRGFYNALIASTDEQLRTLRTRKGVPAFL